MHERLGRTDLPGGDAAQLTHSIELLLTALPEETVLFPGTWSPLDDWRGTRLVANGDCRTTRIQSF